LQDNLNKEGFMKRNQERWIWIITTLTLATITAGLIFAPQALARARAGNQPDEYLELFESAYFIVLEHYVDEVDPRVLYDGAMKGMLESLEDPYSQYINEEMFLRDLNDTTSGEFGGVGLYISKEPFDEDNPYGRLDYVNVVAPIEGTPAYKAGIHAGDLVYEIDGVSAEGYTVEEVSQKLRGRPDTDVDVTFLRNGEITYTVTITRAVIEIPTVKYDVINDHIGFLRIIQFTPHTPSRTKEALEYFLARGCDSLIIDLRSNPGGLLSAVVEIGDYFFSGDIIVSTKSRIEEENAVYRASRRQLFPSDIPIVIMIDSGSASASEILTGAMRDNERAVIIGSTSYGKASVQQVIQLENSLIKLTTAKYLTPGGFDINQQGIDPDITVEEPEFSEEEVESYKILIQENRIGLFITENPSPTENEIRDFITALNEEGIVLEDRYIRRLIKIETERGMDDPPIFDLEYDNVLIEAVDYLEE
jgi:carboxyl-terminal processing protease